MVKDLYPQFSEAEFSRRFATVRAAMKEADLPVLLVYGSLPLGAEVQYLCNYPTTWEAFLLFPAEPGLAATHFAQLRNHIQLERSSRAMPRCIGVGSTQQLQQPKRSRSKVLLRDGSAWWGSTFPSITLNSFLKSSQRLLLSTSRIRCLKYGW